MGAEDFIIADFQQQYEEYRRSEASRIRYVEYYITLLTAIVAFYGVIIKWKGLPVEDYRIAGLMAFILFLVGEIGRRLVQILVSTRIAQLLTFEYIRRLREYFFNNKAETVLKYCKIAMAEKWFDEKSHAIRLIFLVLLLSSLAFSVATYQLIRFIMLVMPNFSFKPILTGWKDSIGLASALGVFCIYYLYYKNQIIKEFEKKEKEIKEKLKKHKISAG